MADGLLPGKVPTMGELLVLALSPFDAPWAAELSDVVSMGGGGTGGGNIMASAFFRLSSSSLRCSSR